MENQVSIEKKEKAPGALTLWLDKCFHLTERDTTVGYEVKAGLGAFCIAVCALLMNTQIVGQYYGNYAGSYLAVSVIAFAGTLLMGILCNLPLLQTANLGMSTAMVTLLGANTGLTYANVLFVTFLAAVVYLVIVVTPLKKIFLEALPDGVKKALPVGMGLYVAMQAFKNTGLLTSDGTLEKVADLETLDGFYFWLLFAGILLVVVYTAAKRKNALGSTFYMLIAAMWVCGIVFYMEYFVGGQTATTLVYQRVNLIFATDGASPYNLAIGLSSLKVGELFKSGLDFSAFTEAGGNVALFVIESVLTFLFLGMYSNCGNMAGAAAAGGADAEDWKKNGAEKAMVLGAVMNVAAPLLGTAPTAIGAESAVGTKDGAKTGLSSLAASIGYLIAMFTWAFFAIFATTTNGVGMWINDTETKLAAYVQDGFIFADLIMVFAGLAMLKGVRALDTKKAEEWIPFAATLAGAAFFGDITMGVAFGVVLYCIFKLIDSSRKEIKLATIILAVILTVYTILALKYGGNYITQTMGGMGMGGMGGPMGGGPM